MTKKIKIGADELILWLRKNHKAVNIPNDGIQGLGIKIQSLIVGELSGVKVIENHPSYWASLIDAKNIQQFNLPKTSAQYEIEIDKLGSLYESISAW